jgi:proteasome lid subunit RPN8/RPN11
LAPFPPIERWLVPETACEQTREAVLPAGRRGTESGVFWLGERAATSIVRNVAMPVGAGVVEEPWKWSVSAELYAAVAGYAKPRGLTLLGVVHTHLGPGVPRLSRTDRMQGLKVQDALAVIVGSAGEERDPDRWGWFVYDDGDYRDLAAHERAKRVQMTDESAEFIEISVGASS